MPSTSGIEQGVYHLGRLGTYLDADLLPYLHELEDGALLRALEAQLESEPTWKTQRFGSVWELRLYRIGLYALVRAVKPAVMVETGVLHGLTSAFLLAALDRNGHGRLVSIDLPSYAGSGPANADGYDATLPPGRQPGWAVPAGLTQRWDLRIGRSLDVLPGLIDEGPLDIFLHDSEHTYETMTGEFDLAWPALSPGGVLISDNVGDSEAFADFCARHSRRPLLLPAPDLHVWEGPPRWAVLSPGLANLH